MKRFRDELLWQEYARHLYARLVNHAQRHRFFARPDVHPHAVAVAAGGHTVPLQRQDGLLDLRRRQLNIKGCRPSQPAEEFFVVLSGKVKVFKLSARGDEQILHLYGSGETFGEAAAWTGGSSS